MPKTLLVIGATGNQGSAVLEALHQDTSSNNTIYAIHRKPASAPSLLNKYPSIKPIQGDMNDSPAIFRAIGSPPNTVFFMTPSDSKNEIQLGKAIISAAVQAGTKHIVMSSIDRGPGGNITYTIIRPAAFLENFFPGFVAQIYASVWRDCVDGNKMALVSTKDIGVTATKAMLAAEEYRNAEINLAGDDLTFEEASAGFEKETGKKLPTANKHLTWMSVAMMKD